MTASSDLVARILRDAEELDAVGAGAFALTMRGMAARIAALEADKAALVELVYMYVDPFEVAAKHEALASLCADNYRTAETEALAKHGGTDDKAS